MLGSLPGGPSVPEARRRLASGLPLAVGLPRDATEKLQGELVDVGLVPRIGPAPEGTLPLVPTRPAWSRAALLVLGVLAALGLWGLRNASAPAAPPSPAPALPLTGAELRPQSDAPETEPQRAGSPEAAPAEQRLELWAQIRRSTAGLQLVGWVRSPSAEPPGGPLVVVGRAGGFEVLNTSFEASSIPSQRRSAGGGAPLPIRTVPFRLAVERSRLMDAEEIVLEASWGEWRSQLLIVKLPDGD